jgi:alkylhydroperoxidase/carboxymuconolactone decarboxylase family protein YurZ
LADAKEIRFNTGLSSLDDDAFDDGEWQALADWYARSHGFGSLDFVPFVPFLHEFRPGALKRWRRLVEAISGEAPALPQLAVALLFLHYYSIIADELGIRYEILAARHWGASKAEVLEVISYAFLTAGPHGINSVARAAREYMEQWDDESADFATERRWPATWCASTAALKGLDFRERALADEELDAVKEWYREVDGSCPRYVEVLAKYKPRVLKEICNRFEFALSGDLPVEMAPLLTLHAATIRGDAIAIRRAALRARKLKVTRDQFIETLCWALPYCGESGFEFAVETLEDVITTM